MALKAPVQRRSCQMRDRRLKSMETIIQRLQSVRSENDGHRLVGLGQNSGSRVARPSLATLDSIALPPFGDRLRVDAQLSPQRRDRSFRSLYCCSDSERSRGAPVASVSETACFHSTEGFTPSNRGIKNLAGPNPYRFAIVSEGSSPNSWRYSPAKRPSSPKPQRSAHADTDVSSALAWLNSRCTRECR